MSKVWIPVSQLQEEIDRSEKKYLTDYKGRRIYSVVPQYRGDGIIYCYRLYYGVDFYTISRDSAIEIERD